MNWELFAAFFLITVVLVVTPGPIVTLVIATGAHARRLSCPGGDLPGVFTLRTIDDARAIRAALQQQPRVAVVGAGFIGLEVAASCRKLGLAVTLVEPEVVTPLVTERVGA